MTPTAHTEANTGPLTCGYPGGWGSTCRQHQMTPHASFVSLSDDFEVEVAQTRATFAAVRFHSRRRRNFRG